MYNEFSLEVANTCESLGLFEGDEVTYSPHLTPRGNGKELAVMEINGNTIVAAFTKYGTQYIIIGDRIQAYQHHQVRIIGKVIDGSHVVESSSPVIFGTPFKTKKPTAVTVGSWL